MEEHGHTVVEMVIAVAIVLLIGAVAAPTLRAYAQESHLLGAGLLFVGQFREARSVALRTGEEAAIRFEPGPTGTSISLYVDGNHNGVRSTDIAAGIDRRIAGPTALDTGSGEVRVAINAGVPAIPPDRGILDPGDPIRFGVSNMVSFSPLGTASPGTFYLAGSNAQAAVRVTPGSARVRLMVCRGQRWVER